MRIAFVEIKNFRKLKSCRIDFSEKSTVFVGANNSGKTSAMDALILFLKDQSKFSTRDFTLSNWKQINAIGWAWVNTPVDKQPNLDMNQWAELLPQLDVWIQITDSEIHYVTPLIPSLDWKGELLGVRLRWQPLDIKNLYEDFLESFNASKTVTAAKAARDGGKLEPWLWPKSLWDYLDRKLLGHFGRMAYILDQSKILEPSDGVANPQPLVEGGLPIAGDPFNSIIKVDIINAQRGFYDSNTQGDSKPRASSNLSAQFRDYYNRHLNPADLPALEDLDALQAIEDAKTSFDEKLSKSFLPSLKELADLNYPGFGNNPTISISSKISPIDGINHPAAVQFEVMKEKGAIVDYPLSLPETYNGLGYQNLISMVFKLISFRDDWMKAGKVGSTVAQPSEFEPLHLVLVEEPEAHLHAQVQQVFIKRAYDVLRNNDLLRSHGHFCTQLVVSTHSNHIAYEIPFTSLRYFRRRPLQQDGIPISTVVNLSTTFGSEDETTKFAIRYLRTTHCDLFFADAAILLEGPAERVLVPDFIRQWHPRLDSCFISLLEIGGSHSHTLRPLLQDLGIITLVITDIDSVDPSQRGSAVLPERGKHYKSGNFTLKSWLPKKELLDELMDVTPDGKVSAQFPIRVCYQTPIKVKFQDDLDEVEIIPYTFEIALGFDNLALLRTLTGNGLLGKFCEAALMSKTIDCNQTMFNALQNAKKAAFALDLLYLQPGQLQVPKYISEGLTWLETQLVPMTTTNPI